MSPLLTKNTLKTGLALLLLTQLGTACGRTEHANPTIGDGSGGCNGNDSTCSSPPECPWGTSDLRGTGCWIVEGCGSPSAICEPTCPGYNPCVCGGFGSEGCAVGAGGSVPLSIEQKLASCGPLPAPAADSTERGMGGMGGGSDQGISCGEECGFCQTVADCCTLGATTYCLENRCIGQ